MKHTYTYLGVDAAGDVQTHVVTTTNNIEPANPDTFDGIMMTIAVKSTYYETPLKKAFVVGRQRAGEKWIDVAGAICHPRHT